MRELGMSSACFILEVGEDTRKLVRGEVQGG